MKGCITPEPKGNAHGRRHPNHAMLTPSRFECGSGAGFEVGTPFHIPEIDRNAELVSDFRCGARNGDAGRRCERASSHTLAIAIVSAAGVSGLVIDAAEAALGDTLCISTLHT